MLWHLWLPELSKHTLSVYVALQIVRLAKRLPQGDVKLSAAALGTQRLYGEDGDGDENDLT